MGARWKTQPVMDNPSSTQRIRPQVYVRLEFGVSWLPRHVPNTHEVTYKSRRIRERSPYFPRRVPASNTNFLTAPPAVQQHQGWQQIPQRDQTHHHHRRHEPQPQIPHVPEVRWQEPAEEPRRSRAESTSSSHERRRSAPPPLGDNPWDVAVTEPQGAGFPPTSWPVAAVAVPPTTDRPPPAIWKDLPEVPSRFRLGEVGMPWTPWSWPMGHEPGDYPQDETPSTHAGGPTVSTADGDCDANADANTDVYGTDELYSVTPLPAASAVVTSPATVPFAPPPLPDDDGEHLGEDLDRARQLESLSAAMMTVDNGFENQWWNQGERESICLTDDVAISRQPSKARAPPQHRFSLGWAVASSSPPPQFQQHGLHQQRSVREATPLSFSLDGIVSPVSDYASTTSPPHFYSLERTLSTRSEELFLH